MPTSTTTWRWPKRLTRTSLVPEQVDWLHRLDLERGNLRSALQWAFTRPEREPALRLAAALGSFWDIRGERSEGLERLEQALQSSADVDARLRARLSRMAGRLARGADNDRAVGWLEQSLEASSDPSDRVAALVQLGIVWVDEAKVAQAIATLEEAVVLAEELGDRSALAAALGALGQALLDNMDYVAAVRLLERSLDESRRLGDRIGQAGVLAQLAMARLETADVANVREPLEEAQDLLLELGDAVGVAWTEHDLARLALDQGEFARAAALFDGSLRLFQAIGYRTGIAQSTHGLGRAQLAMGDDESAVSLFRAGLDLFVQLGHERGRAWALYNLAWAAGRRGEAVDGWRYLVEGLPLFRALSLPPGVSACLTAAAYLAVNDEPAQAARWLGLADRLQNISMVDRRRVDQIAALAAQHLGAERMEREWSAGHQLADIELELDRVLAYAEDRSNRHSRNR